MREPPAGVIFRSPSCSAASVKCLKNANSAASIIDGAVSLSIRTIRPGQTLAFGATALIAAALRRVSRSHPRRSLSMYGLVFGCLTLALAILVFALIREIRLRRAWQRLWFVFVEQERCNAEEE
jgi:hypothetical protein